MPGLPGRETGKAGRWQSLPQPHQAINLTHGTLPQLAPLTPGATGHPCPSVALPPSRRFPPAPPLSAPPQLHPLPEGSWVPQPASFPGRGSPPGCLPVGQGGPPGPAPAARPPCWDEQAAVQQQGTEGACSECDHGGLCTPTRIAVGQTWGASWEILASGLPYQRGAGRTDCFSLSTLIEKMKSKEASSINAAGERGLALLMGLGQGPQLLIQLKPGMKSTAKLDLEPAGVRARSWRGAGWCIGVSLWGRRGTRVRQSALEPLSSV